MTERRDEERERRKRDRAREDEADRRAAETERRNEELREAWRRHHSPERPRGPRRGSDRPADDTGLSRARDQRHCMPQ